MDIWFLFEISYIVLKRKTKKNGLIHVDIGNNKDTVLQLTFASNTKSSLHDRVSGSAYLWTAILVIKRKLTDKTT
jgi:hypothetical protein